MNLLILKEKECNAEFPIKEKDWNDLLVSDGFKNFVKVLFGCGFEIQTKDYNHRANGLEWNRVLIDENGNLQSILLAESTFSLG